MDKKMLLLEKIIKGDFVNGSHVTLNDPPILSKKIVWPQLNTGDDQMNAGSTLIMYSNGTAVFSCQTLCYQTHSGDVWHHFIYVKNAQGQLLFTGGTFDSPRMNDGNPPPVYSWSASFTFDPALFDSIESASLAYSA